MSLSVQKINLDLSIIRFENGMTPEEFARELSGVIGKDIWRYTKNKYLNSSAKSEYVFYCGMGSNEQKYSVLEDGAILIDNNTKKQIAGFSDLGEEELKSKIGDEFKGYNITISLLENIKFEDIVPSIGQQITESKEELEMEDNKDE